MLPANCETAPVGAELVGHHQPGNDPIPKLTAKIFDQKWYSERQTGFLF